MANKHLQQHNIWPLSINFVWTVVLFGVTMIFGIGQLYNRFITLEGNFNDYKREVNQRLTSTDNAINDLRLNAAGNISREKFSSRGEVQGVATVSPKIIISPTPTIRLPIKPTTVIK